MTADVVGGVFQFILAFKKIPEKRFLSLEKLEMFDILPPCLEMKEHLRLISDFKCLQPTDFFRPVTGG